MEDCRETKRGNEQNGILIQKAATLSFCERVAAYNLQATMQPILMQRYQEPLVDCSGNPSAEDCSGKRGPKETAK